jgi:hypothetical protein
MITRTNSSLIPKQNQPIGFNSPDGLHLQDLYTETIQVDPVISPGKGCNEYQAAATLV